MELPAALLRMLDVSCEVDQLKNWSVYQERDGCYTFKIRFLPNNSRHVDDQPIPSNISSTFKRKSSKQIDRDCERNKAFQEKRITRSQTSRLNADASNQITTDKRPPIVPVESPIEMVRHQSSTSSSFNICSPVFIPSNVSKLSDTTPDKFSSSNLPDKDSESDDKYCSPHTFCSSCELFAGTGICHPSCLFASSFRNMYGVKDPYTKCMYCPKCESNVCKICVNMGGHECHKDILVPSELT